MQKADIVLGEEYGFRESRKSAAPLERVRILQHVRGKKWKAEWIEPNAGLVDFVEAQDLVVRWSESPVFLADEAAERRLKDEAKQQSYEDGSPIGNALHTVFDSAGDKVRMYRGILSGPAEAFDRLRVRAGIAASSRSALEYVDRHGITHAPLSEALALAKAFCAKEPATVLSYIEPTEKKWALEAKSKNDEGMAIMLSEHRAAWAIVRQWTSHDQSVSLRREVERLRRLVLDAVYALQSAGMDATAHALRVQLPQESTLVNSSEE